MDLQNLKKLSVLFEVKLMLEQLSEKYQRYCEEERDANDRFLHRLRLFEEKYFNNRQFEDAIEEVCENPLFRDELEQESARVVDSAESDMDGLQVSTDSHCETPKSLEVSYKKKVSQKKARGNFQLPRLSQKSGLKSPSTINSSEKWENDLLWRLSQILNCRYVASISHLKAASNNKVWSRLKWSIYLLRNNLVGRFIYFNYESFSLITESSCTSRVLFRGFVIAYEDLKAVWVPEKTHQFKLLIDRTE
jgi:hypothetical protein